MSILFVQRHRWLASITVVLLMALTAGVWLASAPSSYGQARGVVIPDLRGKWQGTIAGYGFADVRKRSDSPQYVRETGDEYVISIDVQRGRAFAGVSPHGAELAGVILPDGTIRMQAAGESGGLRSFTTCTLAVQGGKQVMTGTSDVFDDLFPGGDAIMGTLLVRYVKLD